MNGSCLSLYKSYSTFNAESRFIFPFFWKTTMEKVSQLFIFLTLTSAPGAAAPFYQNKYFINFKLLITSFMDVFSGKCLYKKWSHQTKEHFIFSIGKLPCKLELIYWWNCLAKRFEICHILCIRKPKIAFSIFHFVLLYFFPN